MINLITSSAPDAFMQLKAHLLIELSEYTAPDLPESVLAKTFAPNIPPDVRAAAMGELVDAGLVELTKVRGDNGRLRGSGYRITQPGASYVAQIRTVDGVEEPDVSHLLKPAAARWHGIDFLDTDAEVHQGLECMLFVAGHSASDPSRDVTGIGYARVDRSGVHGFRQSDLQRIEVDAGIYGPTLKVLRFVEMCDILPAQQKA